MRVKYFKDWPQLFIGVPVFSFFSLGFIIVGIILACIEKFYLPFLMLGIILLLITICFLLLPNYALTRVIFSEVGVEVKWFKKQLTFVSWEEITSARATSRGKAWIISLYSKNKVITIFPSKKIYDAIIALCPNQNIKNQIKNDIHLKWYNKQNN